MKKLISLIVVSYMFAWGGWLSGQLKCHVAYTTDKGTKVYQLPVWGAIGSSEKWVGRIMDGSAVMTDCFESGKKK